MKQGGGGEVCASCFKCVCVCVRDMCNDRYIDVSILADELRSLSVLTKEKRRERSKEEKRKKREKRKGKEKKF